MGHFHHFGIKLLVTLFLVLQLIKNNNGSVITEITRAKDTTYTTKFDNNVDINEVIHNERMLRYYVECLMDRGPCTPLGEELKKNLPDAINNNCTKCTDFQKNASKTVMNHLIDHNLKLWNELEKKYQSDGSYKNEYLKTKTDSSKENKEENNLESNSKENNSTDEKSIENKSLTGDHKNSNEKKIENKSVMKRSTTNDSKKETNTENRNGSKTEEKPKNNMSLESKTFDARSEEITKPEKNTENKSKENLKTERNNKSTENESKEETAQQESHKHETDEKSKTKTTMLGTSISPIDKI